MTLYVNNRHWTISKKYKKDEITIMSTLDEKGLNLDKNIGSLIINYLNWIQSEQIYTILRDSRYLRAIQNDSFDYKKNYGESLYSIKEMYLASTYYVI